MDNELIVRKSSLPSAQTMCRAAQYVRMSTDKQQYSIQNQAAVIAAYAHAHNLTIVRTYADEGESGLRIKNRAGLRRLIEDVQRRNTDFGHILVYDISRWGRFQDMDESAHYEFICRQAGIKVAYCAEQFDNDGSMLSSIVKNLKRVMAAEFSRELSVKVHEGSCRLVRNGYAPGGLTGYALRRELVDKNLQSKGFLKRGEHKFLSSDHIRLRPGDETEIAIVRWIFERFIQVESETAIAKELNQGKIPPPAGKSWSRYTVTRILKNENYVGNIVYNRRAQRLHTRNVPNPPELWVRGEGCIEPIVHLNVFLKANAIIKNRRVDLLTDEEMLTRLRQAWMKEGRLSPKIIDRIAGLPAYHTYRVHFGSIRNAYRLIGYTSKRNCEYIDSREAWAEQKAELAGKVAAKLKTSGIRFRRSIDCLHVAGAGCISFRIARWHAGMKATHLNCWIVQRYRLPDGWVAAIRLTESATLLDYVLLPTEGTSGRTIKFSERARMRRGIRQFDTSVGLVRAIIRRVKQSTRPSPAKQSRRNTTSKLRPTTGRSGHVRH
ncbi:recombinase family protein [Bradyrhizobium sp.]|uniref:recombinase family protein n=1 Tax=Bradyrhizobium sp. TaxID=376 RepID=UPI002DDCAAAB|nr:recombinase family protein [Bradyrhizobium sp.]HEV2160265.1 recombinase family protein [Bradyrhizobium sp.]